MIVIFDIAGPLLLYSVLRSAGLSAVSALILSGIFPAIGVIMGVIQHRRLDVIGALVLTGILVGTVLGLASHNARLVLLEGSVPTALFGLACIGSLWARRPLIFSFALAFAGPDTGRGRELADLWQYWGFRHAFRVITVVWGVGYLVEAGLRAVIVERTSTGTALVSSKVLPFVVAAILGIWTVAYGRQQRRKGERLAAAAADGGPPTAATSPRPRGPAAPPG